MQIQENISLRPFNTFGIDTRAAYFARFQSQEELEYLMQKVRENGKSTFILGGGSNILFRAPIDGYVLKNEIPGIEEVHEDQDYVFVRVGAGENWHAFVQYSISRNWAGAENLSLIPGNVGASPMQNIGAYGVEIRDIFHSLDAWHIRDRELHTFTLGDCEFGYRESVFKKAAKGEYVILSVTFRLRKHPIFHTSYGAIQQELERMNISTLSIRAIADAVIAIRRSKLPDPREIGNAGSFFKNPVVSNENFELLKSQFPDIVGYPQADASVKLAAGWMIEKAGWKGVRRGDAGVHEKQALVLVNYGNASGENIYNLSSEIVQSVEEKFQVRLEREVNIVG